MKIMSEKRGDAVVVALTGRMDNVSAMEYEKALNDAVAKGEKQFVVDLSGLEYITSAGLRSFLAIAKKVKDLKGWIRFCALSGMVKEVFSLSGFDTMFKIYKDTESAVKGV